MATSVSIVTIRFGKGMLMQSWHNKVCAKKWLEGKMADITQLSPPCIQKIHLPQNGYSTEIFLNEFDSSLIDYYVIPKLVELVG